MARFIDIEEVAPVAGLGNLPTAIRLPGRLPSTLPPAELVVTTGGGIVAAKLDIAQTTSQPITAASSESSSMTKWIVAGAIAALALGGIYFAFRKR